MLQEISEKCNWKKHRNNYMVSWKLVKSERMVGEGITYPQERVRRSIGESGGKMSFLGKLIELFLKKLINSKTVGIEFFIEFGSLGGREGSGEEKVIEVIRLGKFRHVQLL